MKNKKIKIFLLSFLLAAAAVFFMVQGENFGKKEKVSEITDNEEGGSEPDRAVISSEEGTTTESIFPVMEDPTEDGAPKEEDDTPDGLQIADIPEYNGKPFVSVNGNVPFFTEEEIRRDIFEEYSELDSLGRAGKAFAMIDKSLMPVDERGDIGDIKPSGWHTVKYDGLIADRYLYNRCHLIGYQLTGKNADPKNLMTGTRYFNTEGMQSFENQVADYINNTGNKVLYRVTPMYNEDDLVASGVLIEALSVDKTLLGLLDNLDEYTENYEKAKQEREQWEEDFGSSEVGVYEKTETSVSSEEIPDDYDRDEKYQQILKMASICFAVYVYNIQPGVVIDYATGDSHADNDHIIDKSNPDCDYIINKKTKKFHLPDCEGVKDMKDKNKWYYTGDRQKLIDEGYVPCKICEP